MNNMKYFLLLGVASAFLLSGNLSAEEDPEPAIGSLFDDVDSGARFDDVKPQLPIQGKKKKQKLTPDEIAAKKAAGEAKRNERNNKSNNFEANDLDTSINETLVELPKVDIDNALAALDQAKAALEDTKQKAAEQDQAVQAEAAAKKKAEEDAVEHERLKKLTPEDHRRAAEATVLADHQHKFATALATSDDGAVQVTPTHENEINGKQATQLREMGVGTDIKAELVGQEPMSSSNSPDEAKDQESKAEAVQNEEVKNDAAEPKADADQLAAVDNGKKVKPKKEKKQLTDEEKADKKAAGKAKRDEREAKKNASQEEDLDTAINDGEFSNADDGKKEKKLRKKLDEEGKKAHEEKMKKQKVDSEEKKASKKEANVKKKEAQIAAGDKEREKRAKRKEENKDKDYTALLNESDTPEGESN